MSKLFFVAIGVGAVVALVASLSVNVLLHWSEPINVLDASQEQIASLTPAEINDKLLSGALRLKMVSGMEKAVYFLCTRQPCSPTAGRTFSCPRRSPHSWEGYLSVGAVRADPRIVFALSIFPAPSQTAQEIFLPVHRGQ